MSCKTCRCVNETRVREIVREEIGFALREAIRQAIHLVPRRDKHERTGW